MSETKRSAVSVFDRLGNRNTDQSNLTDARTLLTHKQSQVESNNQSAHSVIEYRKTNKAPIAFHSDANSGPSSGLLKRLNTASPCGNSSFSSSGESGSCSSTSDVEGGKLDKHLSYRHSHHQQQPPPSHLSASSSYTSRSNNGNTGNNRSSIDINRCMVNNERPQRHPTNPIRELDTPIDFTPPHLKDRSSLKYDRHGNLRVPLAPGSSQTRVRSKSPVDCTVSNNRLDSPSDYHKYYREYYHKSKSSSSGDNLKFDSEDTVCSKSRSRSRHYDLSPIDESNDRRLSATRSISDVERFTETNRSLHRVQQVHHYPNYQHHLPGREDDSGYRGKPQMTSNHRGVITVGDYSPVHSHGSSSKRGSRAGSTSSLNVTASSHRQSKSRSHYDLQAAAAAASSSSTFSHHTSRSESMQRHDSHHEEISLEKSDSLPYKVSPSNSQPAHLIDGSSCYGREMKITTVTASPVSTLSLSTSPVRTSTSPCRTGCLRREGKKRKRRDNQLPENLSVNTIQSQPSGVSLHSGSTSSHALVAQGAADASPFSGGSSIPEFDEFDGQTDVAKVNLPKLLSSHVPSEHLNTKQVKYSTTTSDDHCANDATVSHEPLLKKVKINNENNNDKGNVNNEITTVKERKKKESIMSSKRDYKTSRKCAKVNDNYDEEEEDVGEEEEDNYSDWSEGEIGSGDEQEEGELADEDEESLNDEYYLDEEELEKTVPKLQYGYESSQYGNRSSSSSSSYIRSGNLPTGRSIMPLSVTAISTCSKGGECTLLYRSTGERGGGGGGGGETTRNTGEMTTRELRPMRPTSMNANHEKVVVSSKQSDDLDPISDDELDEILGDSVDALSRVGEARVKETTSAAAAGADAAVVDDETTGKTSTTDCVQSQAPSKGASWQGDMFDCLQIDWASLIGDMDRESASLSPRIKGARSRFSPRKIISHLGFSPLLAGEPLSSELIQLTRQETTRESSHLTEEDEAGAEEEDEEEKPCIFSVNILHDETSDAVTTALANSTPTDGTDPPQASCLLSDDHTDQTLTATDDNNSCRKHAPAKLSPSSSSLLLPSSSSLLSSTSTTSLSPSSLSPPSLLHGAQKNSDGETCKQPILTKGEKEAQQQKSSQFSSVSSFLLGHAFSLHKRKLHREWRSRKQPESLLTAAADVALRQLLSGRRTSQL